jgi:hypothetical protein
MHTYLPTADALVSFEYMYKQDGTRIYIKSSIVGEAVVRLE